MSHSHHEEFFHLFWATKDRAPIITPEIRSQLYPYLGGIVRNAKGSAISIGGIDNHVHLLCYNHSSDLPMSDLVKELKVASTKLIRNKFPHAHAFSWSTGFSSFSVSSEKVPAFEKYIASQEQYHADPSHTYRHELLSILNQHSCEFDERYFLENTHAKQTYHLVWSTYERQPMLMSSTSEEVYGHVEAIVSRYKTKLLAIGGMHDHLHILLDLPPKYAISDLVRSIKSETANAINQKKRIRALDWQEGYGAFTVSTSLLDVVKNYILNQEEHHRVKDYKTEIEEFMTVMKKLKCNM